MASRRPSDRRGGSRRPGAAGPERHGGPRLRVGDEAPLPLAGPPWGELRASGSPAAEQARPGSGLARPGPAPRLGRALPAAAARRGGGPAAPPRGRVGGGPPGGRRREEPHRAAAERRPPQRSARQARARRRRRAGGGRTTRDLFYGNSTHDPEAHLRRITKRTLAASESP